MKKMNGDLKTHVFGYSSAIVMSGSMSDDIEVNDFIITRKSQNYEVGDIITFESYGQLVTHRIVEKEDIGFITKGDANNTIDSDFVKYEDIVGKVIYVIPKIGETIYFLQTPLGMLGMILLAFLIIEIPVVVKEE